MFFMEGTQKKMKLSRKVITHPSFASVFACKCAYLLESFETSITIWRQEYPQNCYI
jgi:hypothetical protein